MTYYRHRTGKAHTTRECEYCAEGKWYKPLRDEIVESWDIPTCDVCD